MKLGSVVKHCHHDVQRMEIITNIYLYQNSAPLGYLPLSQGNKQFLLSQNSITHELSVPALDRRFHVTVYIRHLDFHNQIILLASFNLVF